MNLKSSYLTRIFFVFGLMIVLAGCSTADTGNTESTDSETETVSESGADDDLAWEKLGYYIDCMNDFSRTAFNSWDSYLRNIDLETGPTGEETYIYMRDFYKEPTECVAGIQTANAIKAEPQLNQPATDYASALETLAPLLKEAHEYYDLERFKDDEFAKGKEMHAPLMNAFQQFDEADIILQDAIDLVREGLDERLLAELKKDGDELGYLKQKTMMTAEKMIDSANQMSITDIDSEAFNTYLNDYEAALQELDAYEAAHPEEIGKITSYSLFNTSTQDYLKAGLELMRILRDIPTETAEEGDEIGVYESMDEGEESINNILDAYNNLIDRSNRLLYRT